MQRFEEILAKVARQNRTTPEVVLREMKIAIDAAYEQHGVEVQHLWDMMTFKGDRPTPEEFVLQITMMLDCGSGLVN